MGKKYLKKIIAQNQKDLQIISALCSGSKVIQSEIKFLRENRVFLIPLQRENKEKDNSKKKINSIVKFDYVYRSKSKNIDQKIRDNILELLTIEIFKKNDNFEIILLFSNNAVINLIAEIIEVSLEDITELKDENNKPF
tara:strand:- start:28 stop:444 length:417 start_codon:yes stop_codon:yes gene_type:complete